MQCQTAKQPVILVIDDDVCELDIMSNVLSDAGFRMLAAEDGDSGVNRAIFAVLDIILLDVMMPGIDGFEVCRQLRQNKRTRHIPIFLKTCLRDERSILRGYRAGIDDFIYKPCDHDRILSKIKSRLIYGRHGQFHLTLQLPSL